MKKYIEPAVKSISLEVEDGILNNSDTLNAHNKVVSGSGEGIGEQFTDKKEQDLWGNEDIWK